MVRGSCLCGSVSFEIDGELTSIQYCHAVRCRKATGSAFAAELAARADTFRWVHGAELVTVYEAPLLTEPPPYRHAFCRRCGSPLPVPLEGTAFLALHAGVLDGEPDTQAVRHIFVGQKPSWHTIADEMAAFEQHAPASQRLPRRTSGDQIEAGGQSVSRSSGAPAHRPLVPETITTPRLVLRRPKISDASAVYEYGRDPQVTRFVDWPAHSDIGDAIAATEAALQRWDSGEEYLWRITVKPDDTPVGAVGCRVSGHATELGFVLARRYWGNGYATEAARAALEWVSGMDAVHRVCSTCDIDNAASARVLEKIGMSREGVLRRSVVRPNLSSARPRDALVYSWIRET
jgi:[ribosomal protein S5]-alanine N-acetyltransferase